jgi:hypothetical protein
MSSILMLASRALDVPITHSPSTHETESTKGKAVQSTPGALPLAPRIPPRHPPQDSRLLWTSMHYDRESASDPWWHSETKQTHLVRGIADGTRDEVSGTQFTKDTLLGKLSFLGIIDAWTWAGTSANARRAHPYIEDEQVLHSSVDARQEYIPETQAF